MGYHRRIINEDTTKHFLGENRLSNLYTGESMIFMDNFSSKVYDLFKQGKTKEEILQTLKIENNEDN